MQTMKVERSIVSVLIAMLLAVVFTLCSNPQTVRVFAEHVNASESVQGSALAKLPDTKQAFGSNLKELYGEPSYDKTEIIAEVQTERTATSKTFVQADGTYVLQEYGTPIHYLNGDKYEEIDNTLNDLLENNANLFKVDFGQKNNENLVRIASENTAVSMNPVSNTPEPAPKPDLMTPNQENLGQSTPNRADKDQTAAKTQNVFVYDGLGQLVVTKTTTETDADLLKAKASAKPEYASNLTTSITGLNIKDTTLSNRLENAFASQSSSVYYPDVFSDIDIQYILEHQSLKENIIVHSPQSEYAFRFELELDNLYAVKDDSGSILLIDIYGETVYTIPRGYMYDANGVYSYDVEYLLEYVDGTCFLTVIADKAFFATSKFPVTIDPSVQYVYAAGMILGKHHDIKSTYTANLAEFRTHYKAWTGLGDIYFGYANLGTSTMIESVSKMNVLSAEFSFNYGASNSNLVPMIKSATAFKRSDPLLYNLNFTQNKTIKKVTVNVTDYLNNFLGAAVLSIKSSNEVHTNFTDPVLTIKYTDIAFSDYSITQDLGDGGTGSVNLYDGKLSYVYDDFTTSDNFMPFSISHIYNQDFGDTYKVGNNFKLNIQQKVVWEGPSSTDGNYYYLSASGKKYYFTNSDVYTAIENRELGLKLYKDASTNIIRLIDLQGNSMVFDASGNLIQMHQYPSTKGAPINSLNIAITYSGTQLASISNNFTTLTFNYHNNYLNGILRQNSTSPVAHYTYSGNALVSAEKFFTATPYQTTFGYDGNNRLAGLSTTAGDTVAYTYNASNVVSEITGENTYVANSSNTINIAYVTNTSITDTIVKTVVLSQDNRYFRHVSFSSDLKNQVVSDYSFEQNGNSFNENSAYANKFDYNSFVETYGCTNEIYRAAFFTSANTTSTSAILTNQTLSGTHSYALFAWVKKAANQSTSPTMKVVLGNNTLGTYALNNNITDWQFAAILLEDITLLSGTQVQFNGVVVSGLEVTLVKLPTQLTKAKAQEFTPEFDALGRLARSYQYSAIDNTITMTQHAYNSSTTEYPGLINNVKEYRASANLTKTQFLAQCTLISQTSYGYYDAKYLTSITTTGTSGGAITSNYSYDGSGRLTSTTENGTTTNYTYNNDGSVTTTVLGNATYSPNVSTTDVYDQNTGLLTSTTTGGISTNFTYNNFGALDIIEHNNFNTSFGYTQDGSLQSVSIGNNQLVNYTYSQNQDTVNYANNQSLKYNYNTDGYLVSMYNTSNTTLADFSYDYSGKLISIAGANNVNYDYGYNFDCTIPNFGDVNFAYTASNNGNQMKMYQAVPTSPGAQSLGYTYNGSVKEVQTSSFNSYGALTGINRQGHGNIAYSYNGLQQVSSKTTSYPGIASGTMLEGFSYSNSQLVYDSLSVNSASAESLSYSYYPNGNLGCITRNNVYISEYVYDEHDRLIRDYDHLANRMYVYAYNDGGNILSRTVYTLNWTYLYTDTYTYNSTWKDQLASYNGQAITYDALGNPTSYLGMGMTWQNGRELSTVTNSRNGFGTVTMQYDYAGLRTKKQRTVDGVELYYFWQGNQLMAELHAGQLVYYYYDETGVCGMNLWGQDYYFRKNVLGDIIAMYTSSGALKGTYSYDAYGRTTMTDLAGDGIINWNPFRYRGYYWDQETGLYYLQSRYYDPQIGRFINADDPTALFDTANTVGGANLYAYCFNNPVMYTDSMGMSPFLDFLNDAWKWVVTGVATIAATSVAMGLGAMIGGVPGMIFGGFTVGASVFGSLTTSLWDEDRNGYKAGSSVLGARDNVVRWGLGVVANLLNPVFSWGYNQLGMLPEGGPYIDPNAKGWGKNGEFTLFQMAMVVVAAGGMYVGTVGMIVSFFPSVKSIGLGMFGGGYSVMIVALMLAGLGGAR